MLRIPSFFEEGPLLRLLDEVPTLSLTTLPARKSRDLVPAVEAFEQDGNLVFRAELPGVIPEDVDVTVQEGQLIIKGEKKAEREEQERRVYFREISRGQFQRVFRLPKGVQSDKVEARFENGLLVVTVPLSHPENGARKVPIRNLPAA